ncbi:MAG TPA: radical SAM protein [Spirochaetota bacterium]|nr:radical SAM protein [Spirochaetota bacterium]
MYNKYADIEPFEICSIRPPTENSSISFRLTRNCYWNKCAFCPVYKTGAKFSKRSINEVEQDISRAKKIDDLLFESGLAGYSSMSQASLYSLIAEIKRARFDAGITASMHEKSNDLEDSPDLDERMRWFLSWFKDKPTIEDSFTHIYTWRAGGGRTCFFGDADSLILKPEFIGRAATLVRETFPSIERITIYGRTKSAAKLRSVSDLKAFSKAGINRVHFGLESGSDRVLEIVSKGETAEDHTTGALKVREGGISCSVYVIPGLGGSALSEENCVETAKVLSRITPDFVRVRSLEIFPGTGLDLMKRKGEFTEASEEEVIREIRAIVSETSCETEIVSDSATNLLNINGRLPRDRERMLMAIDSYLSLSEREKIEFSLGSRIESFMGQYGGLTEDIYGLLAPYIKEGRLDVSNAGDERIKDITAVIRGKLMP